MFAGDDNIVADYLRDEFLRSLSRNTRDFLVRTSVLERLSGALCDAILERLGSGTVLEEAAQSNLLLVPLDRRGEWYRYHHLFRDMLYAELRRREPELEPALHARASAWFEANGDPDAAIVHAIAGGDTGRVDSLIFHTTPFYVAAGRTATVQRWLDTFTRSEIAARPVLLLGDLGIARVLVAEAAGLLALVPDGDQLAQSLRQLEQTLDADKTPTRTGVPPMTPAEMRVLCYLPTHLTFAAIGDELFVSRNTIKTQAISIYRKLGVSSRHPAVESARALGLLER